MGDGPEQPSAEELATFAREEELYALGNAAALDSFGLSSALMIFRYRPIAKHLASIGPAFDKAARTKAQIDSLGTTGELEGLASFGWGTWFGRWHRPPPAT